MPTNPQNISPLDQDKNLSIGVGFPLMDDGRFNPTYTVKQQVKSNILNVLLTEPGERLFLPNFGVGLKGLLFENLTNTQIINDTIADQLDTHVPEIEVIDLDVQFNKNTHTLNVRLSYSIQFENQTDSIQVNIAGSPDGVDIYKSVGGF